MQRTTVGFTSFALTLLLAGNVCGGETAAPTAPAKLPPVLQGVKSILFYGDSLTDGSSYPDYVVNTLNRLFPEAGFTIQNAANCGDTADRLRQRLQADVLARKPDLVIVCIGTNDCHGKRKVADFRADLDAVIQGILATRARVVLMKPSPFGKADVEERFQAYLAVIDELAKAHKLLVADAHAEFQRGIQAGREMLGADGIHHGADGFAGMARALLDGLGFADAAMDMQIRPWPHLLTAWESSDPMPVTKEPLDPAKAAGWKPYDRQAAIDKQPWWDSPFAARGAWMPFALQKPEAKSIAFGRTTYDAPQAGPAELQIGGSRPLVVWLNGKEVWRGSRPHGYHPDADRVRVELQAGKNEIVVACDFMAFVGMRALETTDPC